MTTSIPADVEEEIVRRLEDAENRDNIIFDLCESQNLDWKEAESLVDSIQEDHQLNISMAQSPVLTAIAVFTFLCGTGLLIYVIYSLNSMYGTFYAMREQTPGHELYGWKWRVMYDFLIYLVISAEQYLGLLFLGIAMILGSMKGMTEIWSTVFSGFGYFQDRS